MHYYAHIQKHTHMRTRTRIHIHTLTHHLFTHKYQVGLKPIGQIAPNRTPHIRGHHVQEVHILYYDLSWRKSPRTLKIPTLSFKKKKTKRKKKKITLFTLKQEKIWKDKPTHPRMLGIGAKFKEIDCIVDVRLNKYICECLEVFMKLYG